MPRRTLILAAGAWLALVVVCSLVTWTVIDSVGRDVLAGSAPLPASTPSADRPSASAGRAPVISATEGSAPATAAPRPPAPSPSTEPAPSEVDGGSAPTAPATRDAGPDPTPRPGRPTTTPRPTSRPVPAPRSPPTSAPPAAGEVRSWQSRAGTVVARCAGGRIALQSATPSDGYRVETGSRGPEEVEVSFQRGDGAAESQVQVTGVCRGGVPAFRSETEQGGD